jgi:stearoyl-CoA desaturase (delta-9 desaturase)
MKDPVHIWLNRLYFVPLILCGLLLLVLGGWSLMFCGIFLRVVIGLHATWLVNSATHMWGRRRFNTDEDSTNSWWVALLTFGEGWHNNHHAYPRSAHHGFVWYEIDVNWWGIRTLQFFGLATRITVINKERWSATAEAQALQKAA